MLLRDCTVLYTWVPCTLQVAKGPRGPSGRGAPRRLRVYRSIARRSCQSGDHSCSSSPLQSGNDTLLGDAAPPLIKCCVRGGSDLAVLSRNLAATRPVLPAMRVRGAPRPPIAFSRRRRRGADRREWARGYFGEFDDGIGFLSAVIGRRVATHYSLRAVSAPPTPPLPLRRILCTSGGGRGGGRGGSSSLRPPRLTW